ncbi:hypothetical protein MJO28_009300 [Puccinia striiformis f. sp. tritici]|uniref:Uncharacterized protein n=1 Tax=Puccinia striiformis f. sp. tritici TaxID=168172 RepID=A0ACC0E852_9BASI|nr:hypothetical protein MJO28_009300 [Puccinia striiformis f. sp. tritici]
MRCPTTSVTVIGSHTVKKTGRKSRAGWADREYKADHLEDFKREAMAAGPDSPIATHHPSIRDLQATLRQLQDHGNACLIRSYEYNGIYIPDPVTCNRFNPTGCPTNPGQNIPPQPCHAVVNPC